MGANEWMHAYSLQSWMLVGVVFILFIDIVSVSVSAHFCLRLLFKNMSSGSRWYLNLCVVLCAPGLSRVFCSSLGAWMLLVIYLSVMCSLISAAALSFDCLLSKCWWWKRWQVQCVFRRCVFQVCRCMGVTVVKHQVPPVLSLLYWV